MLDEIVVIAGMLLAGKLGTMFTKKVKRTIAPDVLRKYRFWVAEAAFLIIVIVMSISYIIAGFINGKGSEVWLPALHFGAVFFAFFTVVTLFHLFIKVMSEKKKSPKKKTYTQEQLEKMYKSKSFCKRLLAAEQGYKLDVLINDPNQLVRAAVAEQGYGLEILINDSSGYVRMKVAEKGYGLERLVLDTDHQVRKTVAKQGYGLDLLVNDDNEFVRFEVAKQGYGLDKLVNDKSALVRTRVALQGYGVDVLVKDKSRMVRRAAKAIIEKNKS